MASTGAGKYKRSPFVPDEVGEDAISDKNMIAAGVITGDIPDGDLSMGTVGTGTVAGKLNAKYKQVVIAATATKVVHGLGRAPVGYLVLNEKGPSGKIYQTNIASLSAWANTVSAGFISTKAVTSATIMFF